MPRDSAARGRHYLVRYTNGDEQFGNPEKMWSGEAYDARDAVYQAKVAAKAWMGQRDWFRFKARSVEPCDPPPFAPDVWPSRSTAD